MSKKGLVFFILSMVSSAVLGEDYKVDTSNANQTKNPPPMVGASPFVGQTVEEVQKAQAANKPAPNVKKQDVNSASKSNTDNKKNQSLPKAKTNPNSTNSAEALNSNNTGTTVTSDQREGNTGRSSSHPAEGDFNRGY